eukprot:scaffold169688_cov29-Tisochrysis_lutea.AAC.8
MSRMDIQTSADESKPAPESMSVASVIRSAISCTLAVHDAHEAGDPSARRPTPRNAQMTYEMPARMDSAVCHVANSEKARGMFRMP